MFTIFGAIEAQNRVLACCALLANSYIQKGDVFDPEQFNNSLQELSYTEILYLRQEVEEIDSRKFRGKVKQKFVPFESALIGYPIIYGRVFGFDASIDKSTKEWQNLMSLKKLRDLGAHGNVQIHQDVTSSVTFDDLISLLHARKWYCGQLKDLPWIGGIEARGEQFAIVELLKRLQKKHIH